MSTPPSVIAALSLDFQHLPSMFPSFFCACQHIQWQNVRILSYELVPQSWARNRSVKVKPKVKKILSSDVLSHAQAPISPAHPLQMFQKRMRRNKQGRCSKAWRFFLSVTGAPPTPPVSLKPGAHFQRESSRESVGVGQHIPWDLAMRNLDFR